MTEEQKKDRPLVTAGAFIYNKEGKIFLIRSSKWANNLVIPGGKIEFSEKIEDALKREVKEETSLDIDEVEYLGLEEFIKPENFSGSMRHFISLDYKARVLNEEEIELDGREGQEYFWLTPEEVVQRNDVEKTVLETIKNNFIKTKKGFFSKNTCKDCEKNKTENEENKAGWLRALADYKNLQNEISTRRSEWAQMSEIQILEDFIPVYENFKKAFYHHPEVNPDNEEHRAFKNWIDGIGYIMKQFGDILKNHGVEEIKTVGEKFDLELHEAIGEDTQEGVDSQIILKEVDGGYKTKERVIKVAKVIINK